MGATSYYALPYPDPTSTVDVPRDIKALAEKLELWKSGFQCQDGGDCDWRRINPGGYFLHQRFRSATRRQCQTYPRCDGCA